jgi:hypothetical protein
VEDPAGAPAVGSAVADLAPSTAAQIGAQSPARHQPNSSNVLMTGTVRAATNFGREETVGVRAGKPAARRAVRPASAHLPRRRNRGTVLPHQRDSVSGRVTRGGWGRCRDRTGRLARRRLLETRVSADGGVGVRTLTYATLSSADQETGPTNGALLPVTDRHERRPVARSPAVGLPRVAAAWTLPATRCLTTGRSARSAVPDCAR